MKTLFWLSTHNERWPKAFVHHMVRGRFSTTLCNECKVVFFASESQFWVARQAAVLLQQNPRTCENTGAMTTKLANSLSCIYFTFCSCWHNLLPRKMPFTTSQFTRSHRIGIIFWSFVLSSIKSVCFFACLLVCLDDLVGWLTDRFFFHSMVTFWDDWRLANIRVLPTFRQG